MIDVLLVFGSGLVGSAAVVLIGRRSARRKAYRQFSRDLMARGRVLPTGEFTGVHAEGTNALDIVERERSSR